MDRAPQTATVGILAVHGNGGGAFRFERVRPFVSGDVRFRALTLPGFAAVPRDPGLRSMEDYADRLRAMISSEPRPRVLLGHGIGGSIALEFVQRHADEIDGLILHAPVGAKLDSRKFPKLMALPGARKLGQRVFVSRLSRPVLKRLLFSRPVPERYLDRFFEEYRRCSVFKQMFDLVTPGWFRSLEPSGVPAVLLWGKEERVIKVDQASEYERHLPNSTPRIVPNWDHFPMIEQPEEYAREISVLARELVER